MKSFTAKEFSRCPAKVYEAAREDGSVEITHDRFDGKFMLCKVNAQRYEYDKVSETTNGLELARQAYQARKRLIEAGLVPPDQLTEEERLYVCRKEASNLGQFMADNIGAVYPNGLGQLLDLSKKAPD